ncbi:MAG: B12-binding domain-containing radical SAM protein [Planctomycetota bacterium]|jgi:radical SAM superfamily enzyme YgiQ (UPF0313 family)
MDLVLINPGGRRQAYQKLASDLAGIEPPLWIGLLAGFARTREMSVAVVDADAEGLDADETALRVAGIDPTLAVVVVFGANPSASTQKMTEAGAICSALARTAPTVKRALAGLHVSALPERTLRDENVHFVIQGEGPYTLEALVPALRAGGDDLGGVPGLWYWANGHPAHTDPAPLVADLDADLPGAAWDLLPMDRYRAHNWHCFDDIDRRSPYAVIYTSLGCPFTCSFCCINALFGKGGIRYRSPESVLAEIDLLVDRYGVRNIKVIDELFVLKRDRVERMCDLILDRGYDLNFWAYARVDTVERDLLDKMKRAGFHWLAYGFESASQRVRDGVGKRSSDDRTDAAIAWTRQAGIHVIANFIFGLPDDDHHTMAETLAMAKAHNFEFVNFYCAMAYPGSKLYDQAAAEGWALPEHWHQYAQFGAEALPLPTKHLSAAEVLRFRDRAFVDYFSDPRYQQMILERFGPKALEHIREMLNYKMIRTYPGAPGPLGKDA